MRLTDALLQGVLKEEGGVIDVDVQLEKHGRTAHARVVAVEGPEGERRWYLTTVGRDVLTAHEVAEAYRLRWRVEAAFQSPQVRRGTDRRCAPRGRARCFRWCTPR